MGSWNQLNKRCTQGTWCESLCDNNKRGWSIEPIVGWTVKGGINQEIKVKICSSLFLYSKEE